MKKHPALPLARYCDAAILKPESSRHEAELLVNTCIRLNAFSICVRPVDIPWVRLRTEGTDTKVCAVVAFPHGSTLPQAKAEETRICIESGAQEIDMVAQIGAILSADWKLFSEDIQTVAAICKQHHVILKVILETCLLQPEQIARATDAAIAAGAGFVKTSTGFNGPGATEDAIRIMLDTARDRIQVKASGGIRDYQTAVNFLNMGVTRLGLSAASLESVLQPQTSAHPGSQHPNSAPVY